jgi:hypothetical protein
LEDAVLQKMPWLAEAEFSSENYYAQEGIVAAQNEASAQAGQEYWNDPNYYYWYYQQYGYPPEGYQGQAAIEGAPQDPQDKPLEFGTSEQVKKKPPPPPPRKKKAEEGSVTGGTNGTVASENKPVGETTSSAQALLQAYDSDSEDDEDDDE